MITLLYVVLAVISIMLIICIAMLSLLIRSIVIDIEEATYD